jgi:hypothetical protein
MERTAYYNASDRSYRDPYHEEFLGYAFENIREGPVSYIGLPGKRWPAERMLIARCNRENRQLRMVSVENDPRHWPAVVKNRPEVTYYDRYVSTRVFPLPCLTWKYGRIIFGDLSAVLGMKRSVGQMRIPPASVTCFQFDFTGPVHDEIIACCRRVGKFLVKDAAVPFSVVFSIGRERRRQLQYLRNLVGRKLRPVDLRAEALRVILKTHAGRDVKLWRVRQYESPTDASIGIMIGVLLPAKA